MNRIAKKPIQIPNNVTVSINNNIVATKGPKGELELKLPKIIKLVQENNQITVAVENQKDRWQKAMLGTVHSLITNNIIGVVDGFSKTLKMVGVGHKASMQGESLVIKAGFSHNITIKPIENIAFKIEGGNKITISGIDKQQVGQIAAEIRAIKKPEPYKGKGIMYEGEHIIRKQGKQITTTAI